MRSSCIVKTIKINVYVGYGATEDIPEDACSFRQYGWRFDNTELGD